MVARLLRFLAHDSGAVTVDWVVLCAAIVGLGVGATAAVRSGTLNLGGDIQTALGDASVGLSCDEGSTGYDLRILSGDRAQYAEQLREQMTRMSDDEVLAAYAETAEKTTILHDNGENADYVNEVLDYAYLYAQELENRRLDAPEGVQSFDALNASIDGVSGNSCGGSGAGGNSNGSGSGDYDLLTLSGDDARSLMDELSRYDDRSLTQVVRDLQEKFAEAAANGSREDMEMMLDYLYLTYQTLRDRGEDREAMTVAQEAFDSLRDSYNSRNT